MCAQQLKDKTAIVTGASSGIGEAVVVMMAERGASVVLCGRNEARLKAALAKCVQASGGHSKRFLTICGDVTVSSTRKTLLDKTVEKFGKIDILVNSAGVLFPEITTSTTTEELWDKIMDTDLKATFFVTQAVVPFLEKTKGNVVNVSSVWSTAPVMNYIPYAIAKAGVDHMTRCLALDLGPKGIRVNSVSPSFIPDTKILREFSAEAAQTVLTRLSSERKYVQPMGELGTKEQVAEVVLFLASDTASFVCGENIQATGGSHLVNSVHGKA